MRSTITLMLVCVGLYVMSRPYFSPESFLTYEGPNRLLMESISIMSGLFVAGLALCYFFMFRKP